MKINGSKILVTGGAGFIGSFIVEDLVKGGAKVIIYDNFSSGHLDNLACVQDDIEIVEADILDYEKLEATMKNVDLVVHQAAQLEIIKCLEYPKLDLKSNTEGSLNIFEAAKMNDIEKVVYASSACVYGQAQYTPQDESHPKNPNWPYGVSKLAVEHYGRIYNEYYGIKTIGLRYSIVYGPREWYGRVLTAFLQRALDKKPPVIWGGAQLRDFIYVEDVSAFNINCIIEDNIETDVFNVSTGVGTSITELAERVSRLFETDKPIYEEIKEGEISQYVVGRKRLPAELKKMVLDNSKGERKYNWKPKIIMDNGIINEMDWLEKNLERWKEMHY